MYLLLRVSHVPLFKIFLLDFGTVQTVLYVFVFHFYTNVDGVKAGMYFASLLGLWRLTPHSTTFWLYRGGSKSLNYFQHDVSFLRT